MSTSEKIRAVVESVEPLRIVLVDDDECVRAMFGNVLRYLKHTVVEFDSAPSVLDMVLQEKLRIDLIVTDHDMPQMMGITLGSKLREIGFTGPILVHSSSLSGDVRRLYQSLGQVSFLEKPAAISDVKTCLAVIQSGRVSL
jgi:CheY-like chemotaxis protein